MRREISKPVQAPESGGLMNRLWAVVALAASMVCAGADPADSFLGTAAIREDWPGVLAAAVGGGATERYLRAHALLAMNNSGAAFCEIAAASSPETVRIWDSWTGTLVKTHSTSAVARYLRADSLARVGRYAEAMDQFASALKIRPSFTLALNARGVLLASRGDYDRALLDFIAASRANRAFADGHLNRGFYYVQTRQSVAGARSGFSQALALSPGSGLPRLGLALLELAAGDPARADEGLNAAARDCPCLAGLIRADRARVVQWIAQRAVGRTLTASEAGTEVKRLMQEGMNTGDPAKIAAAMKVADNNKDAQPLVKKIAESYVQQQGEKAKQVLAKATDSFNQSREDETVRLQRLETRESKVSASLDAKAQAALRKAGISAGGGVATETTINESVVAKEALKKLEAGKSFATNLKNTYGTKASGVRSDSIAFALVDKGDWPLVPHYALSYGAAQPSSAAGR